MHNVRGQPCTFSGARGETNIDVTLSSEDLRYKIHNWKVTPGVISNDHRMITYTLGEGQRVDTIPEKLRFCCDKADWASFERSLTEGKAALDNFVDFSIDEKVEVLMKAIGNAATESILLRRTRAKVKPPWWTEELNTLRRKVRQAHRNMEQDRLNNIYHGHKRSIFNAMRNRYLKELRNAKRESWRNFCSGINSETWGACFKWINKGSRRALVPHSLLMQNGQYTKTVVETIRVLLDELVPSDNQENHFVRESGDHTFDSRDVTRDEIRKAIWRMGPDKAPGIDGISARILRHTWHNLGDMWHMIATDCFRRGIFPLQWRNADVITLLKGGDKPLDRPKSYRPVSLLPAAGKMLEHLICTRLNEEIHQNMSPKQHGFVSGRSTYTTIREVLGWTSSRREKYVMGVFLDISGAFDNVAWAPLFEDMEQLGASARSLSITRSYLTNRTATISQGNTKVTTVLSKGCPQGSEFGPNLWRIVANGALSIDTGDNATMVAYADDIILLVAGSNRATLKQDSGAILRELGAWANRYTLTFSEAKCQALILKGRFKSPFNIDFGRRKIKTVKEVKYLGVWISEGGNFREHIKNLRNKCDEMFSRLRSAVGRDWGSKQRASTIIYKAVFIPKISYGAEFWCESGLTKQAIAILGMAQRRALIAITGAYRTTSTEGLQVIAGVLPLDLEIKRIANKQTITNGGIGRDPSRLYEDLLDEWQHRWNTSTKARWTYEWFPDIRIRMSYPLELDHYTTQSVGPRQLQFETI